MGLMIACISFLIGNFVYQWMMEVPNYDQAIVRSWFQLFAMLFVVFYSRFLKSIEPKDH